MWRARANTKTRRLRARLRISYPIYTSALTHPAMANLCRCSAIFWSFLLRRFCGLPAHSSSSTHMPTMASLMSLTSTRTSDSSGALTFLPAFVPTSSRASPRAYTPTHALPLSMATARDQPEMGSGAARGGSADPGARGGRARGTLQGHKWCSGSAPRCAVPTTPLCAGAPRPDKVPRRTLEGQFLPHGQFLPLTRRGIS